MKKQIISILVLSLIIFGTSISMCATSPFQFAVEGGYRDGAAIGLLAQTPIVKGIKARLGVEASTSSSPFIIFAGGKFFLLDVQHKYPLSGHLGLISYLGNTSTFGLTGSLILEEIFNVKPLFCEAGIDIVNTIKFQVQLGYYF